MKYFFLLRGFHSLERLFIHVLVYIRMVGGIGGLGIMTNFAVIRRGYVKVTEMASSR